MPTPKTYNNILTKGLQSSLNSTPIQDGKLRFTTDTSNMYLDIAPQGQTAVRIKLSDIITGYTEQQISGLLAPLTNKLYLASDTHRLYSYDAAKGLWYDAAGVMLKETESPDEDQMIWFSQTDEDQPSYDEAFTYNSNSKTLSSQNISASTLDASTVNATDVLSSLIDIDGMQITTTEDASGNRTTDFAFINDQPDNQPDDQPTP